MSSTAASMGSAKRSKKRKPIAPPPESEGTVYDTTATMESGEESVETVTANVCEEMQELEQQEDSGDEEPVNARDQDEEQENGANVEGLQLGYCTIPSEKRFLVLYSFLKRKLSKKMECADIHEKQKQQTRTATFSNFSMSAKGILLCTNVATRGLDIPDVDYIVQYDPLHEPQDYIHNVERTACAEKGKGCILLFLLPQELDFLIYLRAANVHLTEYVFNNKNVPNLQAKFEKIVGENYFLHQLAQEAYRSCILAYNSNAVKETFTAHSLSFKDVAASFSIRNPPKVEIDSENSATRKLDGGGKRKRVNAANQNP